MLPDLVPLTLVWPTYENAQAFPPRDLPQGNTLGKSVMGIKLVNPDGSKPTLQTFLLHYTVGYFINGLVLGLGFIWVLIDPYKQTWGQKLFKDSTIRGNW